MPKKVQTLKSKQLLDHQNLQNEFIYQSGGEKEAILTVDGMSCAACAWLIEMQISKLAGVKSIEVNATSQRATIKWIDIIIQLSEIIHAI